MNEEVEFTEMDKAVMLALNNIKNCVKQFKRFNEASIANFKNKNKEAADTLHNAFGDQTKRFDWLHNLHGYVINTSNQQVKDLGREAFDLVETLRPGTGEEHTPTRGSLFGWLRSYFTPTQHQNNLNQSTRTDENVNRVDNPIQEIKETRSNLLNQDQVEKQTNPKKHEDKPCTSKSIKIVEDTRKPNYNYPTDDEEDYSLKLSPQNHIEQQFFFTMQRFSNSIIEQ